MTTRKKILITVPIVLICFLLVVYVWGIIKYSSCFLPSSYINNQDVSKMTALEAEELLNSQLPEYIITVYDKDGNAEELLPGEYGFAYSTDGDMQSILKKQNNFLWFAASARSKTYSAEITPSYDKELLAQRVEQLNAVRSTEEIEAVDAYIDQKDNVYEIIPEVIGLKLDQDKILADITAAIDAEEAEVHLSDYFIEEQPAVTSDDASLLAQLEELNYDEEEEVMDKIRAMTITHQFGSQERVLEGTTIENWVEIDDNLNITVNRSMVYDYVLSLAAEFNTFGTNRPFTTSSGKQIEIKGGDYGWILYKDGETDALVEIIKEMESVTREPLYESKAATHDGVDTGSPDTYVEIDLGNQYLWYYENGSLKVESPIVSGTKGASETREGTFSVMFKKTQYTLVGETYERPVDYFVAFYTDVGLHDASWRSEFGGSIYLTSGSHGCVNMPRDKVEQIYNSIQDGTIVYCYY